MEIKLEIGENLRQAIETTIRVTGTEEYLGRILHDAFNIDFSRLIKEHAEGGDMWRVKIEEDPINKQFIEILDELFEMFTYYRDFTIRYDGDPFCDSTFSGKLKDEGRDRLHEVEDGIYHKGWNRFEELKQKYLEQTKE